MRQGLAAPQMTGAGTNGLLVTSRPSARPGSFRAVSQLSFHLTGIRLELSFRRGRDDLQVVKVTQRLPGTSGFPCGKGSFDWKDNMPGLRLCQSFGLKGFFGQTHNPVA